MPALPPLGLRCRHLIVTCVVVLVPACGSSGSQSPAAVTPSAVMPSPSQTSANAESWVVLTDEVTGVAFEFPNRVTPELGSRPVAGGESAPIRNYTTDLGGIGVTVAIVVVESGPQPADPADTYQQIVDELHGVGADDAQVSDVRTLDVRGHPATDATITFTSAQGKKSYWRLRTVTTTAAVISLQVQVFATPGDTSANSRVDVLFTKLTSSLTLAP